MDFVLPKLDPYHPIFPDVSQAKDVPNGLLCMGGDLSPARLLDAYRKGIFPWYSEGDPILWWSPDPRTIFKTNGVHLQSKFKRFLKKSNWEVRFDQDFERVIGTCSAIPRAGQRGTWILEEIYEAYSVLHKLGYAHSVEVYDGPRMVGGLYGVAIGQMFFGESMFSAVSGGSKVAIAALARTLHHWGWPMIDCQVENPHLMTLGAINMPRKDYVEHIHLLCSRQGFIGNWGERIPAIQASVLAETR